MLARRVKKAWSKSKKNRIIIASAVVAWITCSVSWQLLDKGTPAIAMWILSGAYLVALWAGNQK